MKRVKVNIRSVFEQIATEVFQMNNAEQAKEYITEFISNTQINEVDKNVICSNVKDLKRIGAVHQYICNSLLKYEGLGVVKKK